MTKSEIAKPLHHIRSIISVLWILFILVSLLWNLSTNEALSLKAARDRGEAIFQLIETARLWNASHSAVYVPITETTQPNPYLTIPNRDVETTDGQKLTMINPAYMTRQLSELTQSLRETQFRLTNLNPIRPENTPSEWEEKSLILFKQGVPDVIEKISHQDSELYRYMAPLHIEPPCLRCHEKYQLKVGDIYGGISIDMPANSFMEVENQHKKQLYGFHAVLLLIGLFLIHTIEKYVRNKGDARLASIDGLTGILNRRGFDQALHREWHRAQRAGSELSILMMDVDYFKSYNDYYGHQQGDQCLQTIASVVEKRLKRPGDIFARYGGEEFIAVFAANREGGQHIAEKIRQDVEHLNIPHKHSNISQYVTISIGLASVIPSDKNTQQMLIALADEALYRAKEAGRNRLCIDTINDNKPAPHVHTQSNSSDS